MRLQELIDLRLQVGSHLRPSVDCDPMLSDYLIQGMHDGAGVRLSLGSGIELWVGSGLKLCIVG